MDGLTIASATTVEQIWGKVLKECSHCQCIGCAQLLKLHQTPGTDLTLTGYSCRVKSRGMRAKCPTPASTVYCCAALLSTAASTAATQGNGKDKRLLLFGNTNEKTADRIRAAHCNIDWRSLLPGQGATPRPASIKH